MTIGSRVRRTLLGAPKDPRDPQAFHKLSLIAFLAWVGLGADGLSSSAYGPDEAFRALGSHTGLAAFLALATAFTVIVIGYGYSRIIEQFPAGGGGYVVASKLLGAPVGVLSGSALLVDYVLTITISLASGADAVLSFLPGLIPYKLPLTFGALAVLAIMNLRGVKESVKAIAPVFVAFLATHVVLLVAVFAGNAARLSAVASDASQNVSGTVGALGLAGTLAIFVRAYALGGGTYTGIEAVSNGVAMMREPRVATARRTMVLMGTSLAVTAGGILIGYLVTGAQPEEGRTMNAVLLDRVASGWSLAGVDVGAAFVVLALVSEGALLCVAAQAGFIDGPRVMANMALDSWLPHRYAALSDRLTMRNGVVLMGGAAALALVYTGGNVSRLVVMYSINVFVTFSLSNVAMCRFWIAERGEQDAWKRRLAAHAGAAVLCLTILAVTVFEKFAEGGWITLVITLGVTGFCFLIKRHYAKVTRAIRRLDQELPGPEDHPAGAPGRELTPLLAPATPLLAPATPPDPAKPVVILFVGGYRGLGRHALLTCLRMFPEHFQGVVFVSIAVVDTGAFKGAHEVATLEQRTRETLDSYVRYAAALGLPAEAAHSVGTDVPEEAEKIATRLMRVYPRGLAVGGQLIFEHDTPWTRLLHNETAFAIQRRLKHAGVPMIILPVRLDLTS
jgi:amino acid transporter